MKHFHHHDASGLTDCHIVMFPTSLHTVPFEQSGPSAAHGSSRMIPRGSTTLSPLVTGTYGTTSDSYMRLPAYARESRLSVPDQVESDDDCNQDPSAKPYQLLLCFAPDVIYLTANGLAVCTNCCCGYPSSSRDYDEK